ncbi:MAG: DUF2974 domain-containing protein [Lachnospiraceae bacterium]|nr:DUF2974 domain-containing protein [Lachnospiraceae bacterium]
MEKPFNDVDSLVLCQFVYLKFDGLVPAPAEEKPFLSAEKLREKQAEGNLFADERFEKDNRALFEGILSGKRFGTVKLNYYVNEIDMEKETQFSAVTFALEDGSYYVAFRGTDENIVGWKEDFNLAFSRPAPAQLSSVEYLDMVGSREKGALYTGGHSKGGNLAVYAAMNCKKTIQDRIVRIYSHDGPGFRPEILEKCGYGAVADRIVKILPHSSLVGMLLESHENYQVIASSTFGIMQHNPFTWRVEDDHFLYVDDIYSGRKFMDHTLNEWILSMNDEQIHAFVETLFGVIEASQTDNLIDFTADWKKSMNGVLNAVKEVDEPTREIIKKIIRSLFEMASERAKQEIRCTAEKELLKLSEKAEENKLKFQEKAIENKKKIQEMKKWKNKSKARRPVS